MAFLFLKDDWFYQICSFRQNYTDWLTIQKVDEETFTLDVLQVTKKMDDKRYSQRNLYYRPGYSSPDSL